MKRSPLKRTKGIRPRSAKTAAKYVERRKLVAQVLDGAVCRFKQGQVSPSWKVPDCWGALTPHEPLTRARGGSILNPENVIPLCEAHHSWTHDHPSQATQLGLLVSRWPKPAG